MTPEWNAIRLIVLEKNQGQCQICRHGSDTHVHHSNYDRLGQEETTDLIVLCAECHKRHHSHIKKAKAKATDSVKHEFSPA